MPARGFCKGAQSHKGAAGRAGTRPRARCLGAIERSEMAERLRGRRGGGRETRTDTQTRRSVAPAAWSEAGAAWSVAKRGGERMPRSGCHEPTREAERRASGRGAEGERTRCGGEEAGTGSGAQRSDGRPTIAFLHCCATAAEHFKAPSGSGRGQAE